MPFDYRKLRGKIKEVYGTEKAFANAIHMSRSTMTSRLNSKSYWTTPEISKSCDALGIDIQDVGDYFFVK